MKKVLLTAAGVAVAIAGAVVWLQAAVPTIGPTAATPAYIVVNTPTPVVITAQIADPSLIAGSVNLLKVDSTGKTLTTVGVMRDDGLSGDAKSADKTFSYRLTVNEPSVGQVYHRVSAAFKGVLKRSLSNVVAVTVDPFLLPPDPGDAGKQTLEGIDSDGDGVRDDLQRFVGITYSSSHETRRALAQFLRSAQAYIVDADDSSRAIDHSRHFFMAWGCLRSIRADANDIVLELERLLKNTPERSAAFDRADSHFGGTVLPRTTANPAYCE